MNLANERPDDELSEADALGAIERGLRSLAPPSFNWHPKVLAVTVEPLGKLTLIRYRFARKPKDPWPEELSMLMPDARERELHQGLEKVRRQRARTR